MVRFLLKKTENTAKQVIGEAPQWPRISIAKYHRPVTVSMYSADAFSIEKSLEIISNDPHSY